VELEKPTLKEIKMHCLQWVAVEADGKDDAKFAVESRLEAGYFTWSDWASVGGRWSDLDGGVVLSLKDDAEKCAEIIANSFTSREAEVKELLTDLDINGVMAWVHEVVAPGGKTGYNYDACRLKAVLDIALGHSTPDSHFYDLSVDSVSPHYITEGESDATHLVAVDFHY
jgi:hypothetical protein